ncbi:MAG TPA: NapC/NirT family cytochrome c [Terriglobales bacterium]|nr:NapC/NirT family cytochrome c [Terriglobales bacterium]
MVENLEPKPTKPESGEKPGLIRNLISFIGVAIAVVAAGNIAFLVFLDFMSPHDNPYIGILAYMLVPGVLVFGLILIPVGMLLERSRRRHGSPSAIPKFPIIDLNSPKQRKSLAATSAFVICFVVISVAGSYKAYEFTDSVQFCGQLCHSVMHPEYTAYQQSPHARVACVECHVGAGATWYVKSKLSGAYQLYAVTFSKFPRPIPTPVQNLRPAQETCEQCHWPKKFWGAQLKVFNHYGSDEQNTPRQVRMLIKTGGGDSTTGQPSGIHWHMNIGNEITYVASDDKRQVIPWVQAKSRATGQITIYETKDAPMKPEQVSAATHRRMDCIDCHNRPTHVYTPPDRSVDNAMFSGRIDPTLPFVKQQTVTLLTASYDSTDQAKGAISTGLEKFYQEKYPDVYSKRHAAIEATIAETQRIFETTIFPSMKVDWRVHPNNIGHFYSAGCFRCHDGNHVSADGKVISKDCNSCHTMLSEAAGGTEIAGSTQGAQFKHPVDIGDLTQVNCADCHSGGVGP